MNEKINKIIKEIEYNLEVTNDILDRTYDEVNKEYKDKDQHLIALGQLLALQNIKYSIEKDNWQYEKRIIYK